MILFAGWCIVACRSQPNLEFNPLHPASALAAGMNREELSDSVRTHDRADEAHLCRLPLILRFRPVTNERWGIDTRATPPDTMLRNDGSVYMSLENRALRDELPSPGRCFNETSLHSCYLMVLCQVGAVTRKAFVVTARVGEGCTNDPQAIAVLSSTSITNSPRLYYPKL